MKPETCDECGGKIPGGREGCRAQFEALLARDFSDARFFRTHRLFVDTYAVSHPDQFCRSAKSFAAHFLDLGAILEHGASPATGYAPLQRWLNGTIELEKPDLSPVHGRITLQNLVQLEQPETWSEMLHKWARETWNGHRKHHSWAQHFLQKVHRNLPR